MHLIHVVPLELPIRVGGRWIQPGTPVALPLRDVLLLMRRCAVEPVDAASRRDLELALELQRAIPRQP